MMKNKSFDCVEMKHQAAEKVQARMAHMNVSERVAYLNRIADEYRARQTASPGDGAGEDIRTAGTGTEN